jgi:glycogen debranching enzyme
MNNKIIKAALIAYLNTDLTNSEKEEAIQELERLQETSKQFWADFLSEDEDLAYHYSDALDHQGSGFYESLPEF